MFRKSIVAFHLLSWLICAAAQPAAWMSGKWGVGLRTPAGGIALPIINNLYVPNFSVNALVNQVKSMGASWLIINLSSGASGDIYISYHPVLYQINPGSTPANVSNGGRDLFGEIATALQAAGIRCIAYAASEGPALLKGGNASAYDYNSTTGTSASVNNWINYVYSKYGASDTATLKTAYALEIATYYANRYGSLVDGWWFDQSNYANITLLTSIVKAANPNTVAMFNDGIHVPLVNSQPGLEDATAGVPSQLTTTYPNSIVNYPMITSVENSTGWLKGPNGELALGHVFMPYGTSWNAIGTQNVWNQSQAADWMGRVLRAGGAWTWNLPRQANGATVQPDASVMNYQLVNFTDNVVSSIATKVPTSTPTVMPSSQPTASPTSSPTSSPTVPPVIATTVHATVVPSSQPTSPPRVGPTKLVTAKPSSSPSFSPSLAPSSSPTNQPTAKPTTKLPTSEPSLLPSSFPTQTPSSQASKTPSSFPSNQPTHVPSMHPSNAPTSPPSMKPSSQPTPSHTSSPSVATKRTDVPSLSPSQSVKTGQPSQHPSNLPTTVPSATPSLKTTGPTTYLGSTSHPSLATKTTSTPSASPSKQVATTQPSSHSSTTPTAVSSSSPSSSSETPSSAPSVKTTQRPTHYGRTLYPTVTKAITDAPSATPSKIPTSYPTITPSALPSASPSQGPSSSPSAVPTSSPTQTPSTSPTSRPSQAPTTDSPTVKPTKHPYHRRTHSPSYNHRNPPTSKPTKSPTNKRTAAPLKHKPTIAPKPAPTPKPSRKPPTKPNHGKLGRFLRQSLKSELTLQIPKHNLLCVETRNVCGPEMVTYCRKMGTTFVTECVAEEHLNESGFGSNDYCGCCSADDSLARPWYCDAY